MISQNTFKVNTFINWKMRLLSAKFKVQSAKFRIGFAYDQF